MREHRPRLGTGTRQRPPEWTRQKMIALLIGAGMTALVLVIGLVLAVVYVLRPIQHHAGTADRTATALTTRADTTPGTGRSASDQPGAGSDPRNMLANQPMPLVSADAAHPGPVSTADPGAPITLPAATLTGAAEVPTGFPHSPSGAMAQLAAIDQVALQSGSLPTAREVIANWAQPGGPSTSSWSLIQGLIALFDETGLSGGGSSQLAIVLTPLMGEIKGSVGTDFVIPCIDFELDVTLQQTARGADADCQRMVWTPSATPTGTAGTVGGVGGRWLIGPGPEPATPPSVWPDTDTAIAVGYHDLRQEPAHD